MTKAVQRIVLATGNAHKIVEIKALLADLPLGIMTPHDFLDWPTVVEDGTTFAENAFKKAVNGFEHTGLACMADDSGLEVDVLGGKPGVLSSRYAADTASDAQNNDKLLQELINTPEEKRSARFRCVIAFVFPRQESRDALFSTGTCAGRIGHAPRGTNGFGYDPLFIPEGYKRTYAELSAAEKNRISHRAKALRDFKEKLQAWFLAP